MVEERTASNPESANRHLFPVFIYDKMSGNFSRVEGVLGALSLSKLPKPIDPDKTTVVEVRGYLYYKELEAESDFAKRTIEGRFKQQTNQDPEQALLMEKVPLTEARGKKYLIATEEELLKSYKRKVEKRQKAAHGIK